MSNGSIDEMVSMEVGGNVPHETFMEDDLTTPEDAPSRGGEFIKKIMTAPTGSGSIESYVNHPMNFNESKSVARILRGLTGMFDNLDYAIIDIIIGGLDLLKSRRKNNYDVSGGSDLYS
jgi:hypothetical protein